MGIHTTFCKAHDEGQHVWAFFCDISKAFDRVWHKDLLYTFKTAEINGTLLQWFTDYLKDRKQRIVLPGATADWNLIKAGVPQGSILGKILFLVFINILWKK